MDDARDLTTMDDAIISAMSRMAKKDDSDERLPVLKISYDEEHPEFRGKWVVGQKKDASGEVIDIGKEVVGFIIIDVYNRYNYYNQADISKNCSSPYHNREMVRGTRRGTMCGKTCPDRADDATPRCKAQKVAFGIAITSDKKLIDCVAYIQGKSYMPFDNYYHDVLTKIKTKTTAGFKTTVVPPFAFITILGSEKRKNKGTIFYEATFERGTMIDVERMKKYEAKRKEIDEYVLNINNIIAGKTIGERTVETTAGTATPIAGRARVIDDTSIGDIGDYGDGSIDATFDTTFTSPVVRDTKKPEPIKATDDDDFDIEAAIHAVVAKASKASDKMATGARI